MPGAYSVYTIQEPFPLPSCLFCLKPLLVELHFKRSTVGPTEVEAPEIIDLSSPSWEADAVAFMDSSEREMERGAAIRRERSEASGVATGVNTVRNKSKPSRHDNASFAKEGDAGKKGAGRERDHPSAPLTSISALFGRGGAKGSRYMHTQKYSYGIPYLYAWCRRKPLQTRGPDPTLTQTQTPI